MAGKKLNQKNEPAKTISDDRRELEEAKRSVLDSAAALDPRNIIKHHPWFSVSGAAAIGAVAAQKPNAKAVHFITTVLTPAITRISKLLSFAAMQFASQFAASVVKKKTERQAEEPADKA